jgi:polyvinyl alcohol dehydrogenase (cytochrome)
MYVASESGNLWALDLSTGCQWWRVSAGVPIRTSVVAALDTRGRASTLYVGDGTGQVRAFDATSGKERWAARVDAHPTAIVTGAPQLHAGVLYVGVSSYESAMPLQPKYTCCTFRGSVVALDAATGRRLWQTYTVDEDPKVSGTSPSGAEVRGPSGAAVWSTPTIDERLGRLYVGTGNNYSAPQSARSDAIIAMDLKTGSVVWSKQFTANDGYNVSCDMPGKYNCPSSDGPDADIGQPPMLVTLSGGGRALLVGAKSGVLRSLDPDRGGLCDGSSRWDPAASLAGCIGVRQPMTTRLCGLWGTADRPGRRFNRTGWGASAGKPESGWRAGRRGRPDGQARVARARAGLPNKSGMQSGAERGRDVADGIVWSNSTDVRS